MRSSRPILLAAALAVSITAVPALAQGVGRPQSSMRTGITDPTWGQMPNLPLKPPHAGGPDRPRPDHGRPVAGGWHDGGWRDRDGARGDYRGEWRGDRGRQWNGGGHYGQSAWDGRYQRFRRGHLIPSYFVSRRFYVDNWRHYALPAPGAGRNWVRYYDDAYLIDDGGSIYDARYGVDWYGDDGDWDRGDWDRDDRAWDDGDSYRDRAVYHHPAGRSRVYYSQPGTTTVIVQTAPVVTTTTTTVVETVGYAAPKRVWSAKPARRSIKRVK